MILRAFCGAPLRTEAVGGIEIIAGVERRCHWRPEGKLRILAELGERGMKLVDVVRRHEVSRGQLWQWWDAQRRGALVAEGATFVPVRVVSELPVPASPAGPTALLPSGSRSPTTA